MYASIRLSRMIYEQYCFTIITNALVNVTNDIVNFFFFPVVDELLKIVRDWTLRTFFLIRYGSANALVTQRTIQLKYNDKCIRTFKIYTPTNV